MSSRPGCSVGIVTNAATTRATATPNMKSIGADKDRRDDLFDEDPQVMVEPFLDSPHDKGSCFGPQEMESLIEQLEQFKT